METTLVTGVPAPVAEPVALDGSYGAARLRARVAAMWELTKPGITRLVLVTTAAGFYLAAQDALGIALLLNTLVGTGLAASGSGVLNQYLERDADARMRRTANRPLPSGRIGGAAALRFGLILSILGVAHLTVFVDVVTAAIVAVTVLSYLCIYTPLKRKTWLATIVGAVPGALPIVAGWTAGGGSLDLRAAALFGIMFVWQMPHFFALAWVYRDDYLRGGFRMLTAADEQGRRTAWHVFGYTLVLLPLSLAPAALGMVGATYSAAALALGATFALLAAAMLAERSAKRAWRVFFGSVVYLPVLLLLMVLDKAPIG